MWGEETRYIYRKQFESALVPNGFSVAYAGLIYNVKTTKIDGMDPFKLFT